MCTTGFDVACSTVSPVEHGLRRHEIRDRMFGDIAPFAEIDRSRTHTTTSRSMVLGSARLRY